MNRLVFLAILATLPCCKSSAPYTVPAVAINTALAAGVSLQQRAQGGCYAVCTGGTACNPRTGYCEPSPCAGCQSWEVCVEADLVWHCAPAGTAGIPSVAEQRPSTAAPPGELVPGVGISPETGTVPLPATRPPLQTPEGAPAQPQRQ